MDGAGSRGPVEPSGSANLPYVGLGFERWEGLLGRNEIVAGPVSEMNAAEQAFLESQDVLSILVIPVYVEGHWWGFFGLDDCVRDRAWSDAEVDSLRAERTCSGRPWPASAPGRPSDSQGHAGTQGRGTHPRTQGADHGQGKGLEELAAAQSSLLEVSRAAGMAEVATGVLHNVGNVLNSVNVSCTLLIEQITRSKVEGVSRVAELLAEKEDDLARFFAEDKRGTQVPAYLASLAAALEEERRAMLYESESLRDRIDHIKEIVSMQQSYGRVSGVKETLRPALLMEDALKLNVDALARHGIEIVKRYEPVPSITVDKNKVLQILLNLIGNAKYACMENLGEKTITLRILNNGPARIRMQVSDNGKGIPPENLDRIFQHGFTTRKSGHGFGLHSGALAARDLDGSLNAYSHGPGLGATFTLELPCQTGNL